jgi:hypothetical protein
VTVLFWTTSSPKPFGSKHAYFTRRQKCLPLCREIASPLKLAIIHSHHPFLLGYTATKRATELDIPLVFTFYTRYRDYSHYIALNQDLVKGTISYPFTKADPSLRNSNLVKKFTQINPICTPLTTFFYTFYTLIDYDALINLLPRRQLSRLFAVRNLLRRDN